ncbi:unnamed protein product [Sphagnum balticum]
MLSDYQGALKDLNKADFFEPNNAFTLQSCEDVKKMLEDLDKANVLEPNNAFTLQSRGNVKRKLKDYQGALEDLDKANVLEPYNAFTLRIRGDVKRMLEDHQGALKDLEKANVLEPSNAFTLQIRADVKRMLEDFQGALKDLDKADVLEPNNAFTLQIRGNVKRMLEDFQGALKDLDKANVLEPNKAFTLRIRGNVKRMLKDYQGALQDLDKADVLEPNHAFTLRSLYKSRWKGIKIAIKVLNSNGSYNEGAKKSFTSEVCALGLTQHINLVRLLGYCIQGSDHILVYEYMSNKSLDKWLSRDKLLNWNKRVSIIIGVAQGLAYLHHKCNPAIIHLDIKPGNILLDKDYTPKLADFGLAKILKGTDENVNITLASTSTPGSFGYMAPEILQESKQRHVSPKCDVYSFGVLLIELVNGSQFTLHRDKIRKFIQWAQKIHFTNILINFGDWQYYVKSIPKNRRTK